jgi:heat shock protein HslJ
MTDEQMDARLRQAGEAWRTASTPVDEVAQAEPEELTAPSATRRRHRTGLLASAAVVAAALVAGGSVLVANLNGGSDKRGADLEGVALQGTVWQFVGYGDRTDDRSSSTLYISADGRLVADDECELLSAQVDASGGTLDITGLAERYKGCVDTYEPAFGRGTDLLTSTPAYAIDADGLTIGAGADAMHFVAAADLPAPILDVPTFTDTDWRLVSATDADGDGSSVDGDLVFRVQDGRFTADEGCNKLSGDLTHDGSTADIKTVESTTLPCPSPQPFEEVMQALFQRGTVDTKVQGAELTITRNGAGSLTYQWVPGDPAATDPSALVGHDWQLASVAGAPASGDVGLYAGPTELSVTYGCSAVGGAAHIGHGTLHINGIPDGAAPGCSGDVGDQSSTIDSFLAGDPLWRVADGKLVITSSGGAQAFAVVFVSAKPPQPSDLMLAGTNWTLTKIFDADKHDVPVAGDATLLIDKTNHLTGSNGCNSISGDVTTDKTTIGFGNGFAITEQACTDDQVTATAESVDHVLQGDVSWSIDGNELALTRDGVGTLVYQEAPPTTKSTDPSDLIGVTWNLTTIETGTGPNGVAQTPDRPWTIAIRAASPGALDFACLRAAIVLGNGTLDVGAFSDIDPRMLGCTMFGTHEVQTVLSGRVTWVIEGDRLTITKDGVGGLVFTSRTRVTDQLALVGTPWQLSSIDIENQNNGSGSGSSDSGVVLTVGTDGGYKLVTGCHNYAGTATISDSTVTFAGQRDLGGDDCLNTMAKALVQFLDGAMTWSITGTELTLTQGGSSATFTS